MALGHVLLALHDAGTGDFGPVLAVAHDIFNGDFVRVLTDMSVRTGVGASVGPKDLTSREGIDNFTALFSEMQVRAAFTIPKDYLDLVLCMAEAEGAVTVCLGATGGEPFAIQLVAERWVVANGTEWSAEASVDTPAKTNATGGAVVSCIANSQLRPETGSPAGSSDKALVFDVTEVVAAPDAMLRSLLD